MQNLKLLINLFTLLVCLTPIGLKAQVTVGDLQYTLNSPNAGEATVTKPNFTLEKGFDESDFTSGVTQYDIVIPSTIEYGGTTYNVTEIGDGAFSGGDDMDNYFNNVRSVTFADNSQIRKIGTSAFFGCNLAGEDGEGSVVKLPASVTSIGAKAFAWTYAKEYDLSACSITTLEPGTFYDIDCKCVVRLPVTLTSIGDWCFGWAQVQHFYYTVNGTEVENPFPPSLTKVGKFAIASDYGIKTATIPATVTEWGEGNFWRCRNLQEIVVEQGNTALKTGEGNHANVLFSYDGSILYCFPQSNNSIADKRFQYKVPADVKRIGDGAFGFCGKSASISKVVLPSELEEIGDLAFNAYFWGSNGRFPSLTIPASVTSLGYACLPDGCTEVVFMGDLSSQLAKAAGGVSYNISGITNSLGGGAGSIRVYVKKSLYDNYKNISSNVRSIGYKIPIKPEKKLTTLCRDFDIQLVDANETDIGKNIKMYIATEKKSNGMYGDGVAGENGKYYQDYMVMTPITYVPSRTGDNNDDYTGVVVKVDDTSTTYYYEIGENDCYSDNQTTLSQTNYLFGAPCYVYVRMNEAEDGSAGSIYKTLGLNDGIFKWYSKDGLITEKKAFIRLPAGSEAKSFAMKFEDADTVTGITNVNSKDADSKAWYSVQGVRLNGKPTTPGMYIHGKHKVIVR
jgi:hypothetical protein